MCEEIDICRLCTSTQLLKDLYKTNDLLLRTSSCTGIMIEPDDGLPPLICAVCEQTINNFHNFKQKCLAIDSKLRSCANDKESIEDTLKHIKQECELLDNDFNDNHFGACLAQPKTEFDEKYFENGSGPEKEDNDNLLDLADSSDKPLSRNNTFPKHNKYLTKLPNKNLKAEKLQCEQCGNMFKTKQILEKHSVTHTGLRMFSCKLCPKQFTRSAHRVVHMRKHMGIKPYICEICGKSSTKRQDLIRHLRIHSDEKKYPCPRCGKRFKRSGDVHAHMRSHTGARPFKCNDCAKSYTSHSGLKKHFRTQCKKEAKVK